jgi:hypothetical protein
VFVIFFGTSIRALRRGVVVDICPPCRSLSPFSVFDYFAVTHFYWVDMAGGAYKGSTRLCHGCSRELPMHDASYASILSPAAAEQTTVNEGLTITNPALAELLAALARLRSGTAEPYREPGLPEALVSELVQKVESLAWLGYDVTAFGPRFARLSSLASQELSDLSAEVRQLCNVIWGHDPWSAGVAGAQRGATAGSDRASEPVS